MLLFLQLCFMSFLSLASAEGMLTTTDHGLDWRHYTGGGGAVGFIILVLDIIVVLELLKSTRPPSQKLLWCLVVFLFPVLGLILYFLLSERQKHRGRGQYEILP